MPCCFLIKHCQYVPWAGGWDSKASSWPFWKQPDEQPSNNLVCASASPNGCIPHCWASLPASAPSASPLPCLLAEGTCKELSFFFFLISALHIYFPFPMLFSSILNLSSVLCSDAVQRWFCKRFWKGHCQWKRLNNVAVQFLMKLKMWLFKRDCSKNSFWCWWMHFSREMWFKCLHLIPVCLKLISWTGKEIFFPPLTRVCEGN